MFLEGFLKYNMKSIKKRNSVFVWLTIILIIMVVVIIRECNILLWVPEKYFFWLICNAEGDKTLYNIAISYVAAYIFYIIHSNFPHHLV